MLSVYALQVSLDTCKGCSFMLVIKLYYRPRSEGDNVLGSVRPSVRPLPLSRLNRLRNLRAWTYIFTASGNAPSSPLTAALVALEGTPKINLQKVL